MGMREFVLGVGAGVGPGALQNRGGFWFVGNVSLLSTFPSVEPGCIPELPG